MVLAPCMLRSWGECMRKCARGGFSSDIRPKPHRAITEHRHTGSSEERISTHPALRDASVAKQLTSLPHPTYVAKHTPAFSLSHLPPKGVFKHQPNLPNLLNTTNTNSNGCFQTKMPTSGKPSVYSNVFDAPPLLWGPHAIQYPFQLLDPHGPAEGEAGEILCCKAPENSATKGQAFHLQWTAKMLWKVCLGLWYSCVNFGCTVLAYTLIVRSDFHWCRCCVSNRIPVSYLEQVREKYLNYDTRAQRKDFLLNCKDPRSRLATCMSVCLWLVFKCSKFPMKRALTISQEWIFSC